MLRAAQVWPVLASARTICDAEAFALLLCGSDIPAAAVHSGLSAKETAARIEALKGGSLKVLVHVSMLAEGADFPWLRGLMLRRRVAARVRFVQEVGRVLRAAPGKREGVVFDPFDLMGEMGLSHPDAIGEALAEEAGPGGVGGGGDGSDPEAVSSMPLADWLAEVGAALAPYGLEVGRPGSWRRARATPAQLRALEGMARFLRWWQGCAEAKKRLKRWIKDGRITGRGDVSDLIGLLRWLADYSRTVREAGAAYGWPQAMAAYQWPEVSLPVQVPTINEEV
jgi:hypothetical protein